MSAKNSVAEKKPSSPPEHLVVFYDARDGSYLYKLGGRYLTLGKSELKLHLAAAGLKETEWYDAESGRLDAFNWVLWNSHRQHMIDYSGALAGHRAGLFKDGSGRQYLVTSEANGVWAEPDKKANPVFFQSFIQELLGEHEQWQYLCHWLAIGLRSMRKGDFRPGQVPVFAGKAGCGKSLLQGIITGIFGGRAANPFLFMMGKTNWNDDLAGAEHWMIEDPNTSTDVRTRREFGANLKMATVNREVSINARHKSSLQLPIFRRLTISVNSEPENIVVVPPMDESIQDKVFLFLCAKVQDCLEKFRHKKDGDIDKAATWQAIQDEIPAIRSWLLTHYTKVPAPMRDDRFGIAAWHHPELMAILSDMSPEARLLSLLDEVLWDDKDDALLPFKGKAIDVEKKLRDSKFSFEADKLLKYNGACGAYLARLSKQYPDRFSKVSLHGYSIWTITKNQPGEGKEN